MASNIRPILSRILPFDAEFGTKGKEHIKAPVLRFSWKDGAVIKNRVVIREAETNTPVYDCTITTMALKHALHNQLDASKKARVLTYSLENGKSYIANLYVYTVDGQESLPSEDVRFSCYNTPEFKFTNFDSYVGVGTTTAAVNSSSINLKVKYYQSDEEQLNTYSFKLQNYNGETIFKTDTKYNQQLVSKNDTEGITLRYTINGIEETEEGKYGEVLTGRAYKIICSGQTKNGIEVYTEQRFIVKLDATGVGALIKTENIGDGTVAIYSNYKVLNAKCSNENPEYILDNSGEKYAIDLSKNDSVEFTDGFNIKKPWEIIIKGKFKVDKLVTLKNPDDESGYLYLKKISYTTAPFYYFAYVVEKKGIEYEIRSEYFRYDKDTLVNAEIDLSYENGLYSLLVNIDYEGRTHIINDDGDGNVSLFLLTDDYSVDFIDGKLEIISNSINVSDNNNGNVTITI